MKSQLITERNPHWIRSEFTNDSTDGCMYDIKLVPYVDEDCIREHLCGWRHTVDICVKLGVEI